MDEQSQSQDPNDLEMRILQARMQAALENRVGAPAPAQPEFSAGYANMQPRSEVPMMEDPNAIMRSVYGLAGAPGMAAAGLGLAGTAARALSPIERLFSSYGTLGAVGGILGIGEANAGDVATPQALALPKGASFSQIAADMGMPVQEFQKKYNGLLPEQAMSALEDRNTRNPPWYKRPFVTHPDDLPQKPAKRSSLEGAQYAARPSGAGERRDKILRDAEDKAMS